MHVTRLVGFGALLAAWVALGLLPSMPLRGAENVRPAAVAIEEREKLIETWGWLLAQQKQVAGIEIGDVELAAFADGFRANLRGEPSKVEFSLIEPDIDALAKARREKVVRAIERRNEAAAKRFLDELKQRSHPVALPDGDLCEVIKPGEGPPPKLEQTVKVHYVAHLIDGTEFMEWGPLDMVLVPNRGVCRGWVDALQHLAKGGVMTLYVPPPLTPDEAAVWGIEPGSAMVFKIELLDIKETSPEALESALAPRLVDEPPAPSGAPLPQVFEAWGWSVGQQSRVVGLGLTDSDRSALTAGMLDGVKGEPAPSDIKSLVPLVEAFVADLRAGARQAAREKRRGEMTAFFAHLEENPAVVELPDGLRYEMLREGDGALPKPGQIVLVDYVGRLIDGSVFDHTDNEPLNVEVGSVIPGWNEGIQHVSLHGKIRLYIPPELGYGERAISGHSGPIPSGSTLIYDIELLDIKDSLPGP